MNKWQIRLARIKRANNLVKIKKKTILKTENGEPIIYDEDKEEITIDPQGQRSPGGLGLGGPKLIR